MREAKVKRDYVRVETPHQYDGYWWTRMSISGYEFAYEGYVAAPAVIEIDGRLYGKSCYDSDHMVVVYRSGVSVAMVVK